MPASHNIAGTQTVNLIVWTVVAFNMYRVVQNKPDYLLLLSKFCISITKHASVITYV